MRLSVAIALIGAVLLCGSGGRVGPKHDTRPWPDGAYCPDDRWLSFEPPHAKRLTPDQFRVVTVREWEAIARLEHAAWVELTADEAGRYFVGRALDGGGGRLVLLRGLAVNHRQYWFIISWRDGEVLVYHAGHSAGRVEVRRRAVIARLPALPTNAYVCYGVGD